MFSPSNSTLKEGALKLTVTTSPLAPHYVNLGREQRYLKVHANPQKQGQYDIVICEKKKSTSPLLCSHYRSAAVITGLVQDNKDGLFGNKKKFYRYLALITPHFTLTLYDPMEDAKTRSKMLTEWEDIFEGEHGKTKWYNLQLAEPQSLLNKLHSGKSSAERSNEAYLAFTKHHVLLIAPSDHTALCTQDRHTPFEVMEGPKNAADSKRVQLQFETETCVLKCSSQQVSFMGQLLPKKELPDVISPATPACRPGLNRQRSTSTCSALSSQSISSSCDRALPDRPVPLPPRRLPSTTTLNNKEETQLKNYLAVMWSHIDESDYVNWCARNAADEDEGTYEDMRKPQNPYLMEKVEDEYYLPMNVSRASARGGSVYSCGSEKSEWYWSICNTLQEVLSSGVPQPDTLDISPTKRMKLAFRLMVTSDGDWQTVAENLDLTKTAADVLQAFVKQHHCHISLGEIILRHWQFIYNNSIKMNKPELCPVPCTKEGLVALLQKMGRYDLLHLVQH